MSEHTLEPEKIALRWVCRLLGVFAQQVCGLVRMKRWTLAQVGPSVEEYRLDLARHANYRLLNGRFGWVDRVFGTSIRPEVREAIEKSDEWQRYRAKLMEIAESQTRERPGYGESTPAGLTGGTAVADSRMIESGGEPSSREIRLQQFIRDHNATYADILHSATVHRPDFQEWRQGRLKGSSVISQRIEDVLCGKRPFQRKPPKRRIR
jgi:hypothetical protein